MAEPETKKFFGPLPPWGEGVERRQQPCRHDSGRNNGATATTGLLPVHEENSRRLIPI